MDDFQKMADVLLRSSSCHLMYRDFQSRNVMIATASRLIDSRADAKVRFTTTCLLLAAKQAKAKLSRQPAPRVEGIHRRLVQVLQPVDEAYFYAQLRHFRDRFRTMQVLVPGFPWLLSGEEAPLHTKCPLLPSRRTCASCSKSLIPNIPTLPDFCANLPRAETVYRRPAKSAASW